jgi:signal transduction histidine kinase
MAFLSGWIVAGFWLAAVLLERRRFARRRELVARACHEVRGPLTAAALAVHAAGREGELSRRRVDAVELELRRAALALDDAGAALGGRRRQDRTERVDVAALLETQLDAWRAVAQAHGCELRLSGRPAQTIVRGDRTRIAQATGNLLANALEHGGGSVAVAARSTGDSVRIEVADTGAGLPARVEELVRRPRAGRGARGRGLAIAADVAARHGGRLTADRAIGRTCVALELPAAGGPRMTELSTLREHREEVGR